MTRHYNPSIVERANRILNTKQGGFLSDEVQGPVATIPITPRVNILRRSAGGTIYTTPTDKDFYLTGFYSSYIKTAADTGSGYNINVTVDGVVIQILEEAMITLTADKSTVYVEFSIPIKLDRGTGITVTQTGTCSSVKTGIHGYTEEVTRT